MSALHVVPTDSANECVNGAVAAKAVFAPSAIFVAGPDDLELLTKVVRHVHRDLHRVLGLAQRQAFVLQKLAELLHIHILLVVELTELSQQI